MKTLFVLLISGCSFVPVASAQAPKDLAGTWVSPTVRFDISDTGHGWKVKASDECMPEWCEWGESTLSLVATSNHSKDYTHAFAVWSNKAYAKDVIFKFAPTGLSVEMFTIYDPNTGRSNYRSAVWLTKEK